MIAGILFFLGMFALSNMFYFVFGKASNLKERFAAGFVVTLLVAVIISMVVDFEMLKQNAIQFSGYYVLLFLIHLFIAEVIKTNKYSIYVLSFSVTAFFTTIFYEVLAAYFRQYF